jgi:hypothetical protein
MHPKKNIAIAVRVMMSYAMNTSNILSRKVIPLPNTRLENWILKRVYPSFSLAGISRALK